MKGHTEEDKDSAASPTKKNKKETKKHHHAHHTKADDKATNSQVNEQKNHGYDLIDSHVPTTSESIADNNGNQYDVTDLEQQKQLPSELVHEEGQDKAVDYAPYNSTNIPDTYNMRQAGRRVDTQIMSGANNTSSTDCCKCLPYKDGLLIAAQVLSIIGLCLAWTKWWNLILTFVGFILLQLTWCCKLNKCGLITGGAFCVLSGLASFVIGILVTVFVPDCGVFSFRTDDYYYPYYDDNSFCSSIGVAIVAYIAGAVMLVAGILTFVFACGSRYEKCRLALHDDGNFSRTIYSGVPAFSYGNQTVRLSSTTTVYHMPDGSKRTEVKTVNPDGSITVQKTIEQWMALEKALDKV